MKILGASIVFLLLAGCYPPRNALIIRDDQLNPIGAQNQLELASSRGSVGHTWYPPASDAPCDYFRLMGSGKKSWVLANWGKPDEVSSSNGTEYLVYTKRSKEAPQYAFQQEGYVKLAFRHAKLVSIEAYCSKCPPHMKGPVHVLPK